MSSSCGLMSGYETRWMSTRVVLWWIPDVMVSSHRYLMDLVITEVGKVALSNYHMRPSQERPDDTYLPVVSWPKANETTRQASLHATAMHEFMIHESKAKRSSQRSYASTT